MFEDAAGGDHAEGGGDVGDGAHAVGAGEAGGGVGGAGVGDGSVALEKDGGFVGEYGVDAHGEWFGADGDGGKSVGAAQGSADLMKQGVFAGEGEVCGADAGGIPAPAGCAAGDGEDVAVVELGEQECLVRGVVNGIDDGIEAWFEDAVGGLGVEKAWFDVDGCLGMDGADALGHGIGFLSADLPVHGVELAVDVGEADFVEIDEGEVADAGAGESFDGPGADAANPDDGDVCGEEALE